MQKILVIDSGLGGASIIKRIYMLKNDVDILFYVENRYAPLGSKSKKKLLNISKNIINKMLIRYDIKIIVFACNTLTSACINELRSIYSIPIIGTEPNVKVLNGKTLVLATPFTIKNCKILDSVNFAKIALSKLSKLIDKNFNNLEKCYNYLYKHLKYYKDFDNVILGCTHYFFIKKQMQKILGDVSFYDSVEGVSQRVISFLQANSFTNKNFELILSKKDKRLQKNIKRYIFDL